ncbi:MAG: chromate transporter, partial [Monoglobales bacterium]
FKESHAVKSIMSGLKPAVIGLIASAVLSIGKTALGLDMLEFTINYTFIFSLVIFTLALFLVFKKKWHPIAVILVSAGMGIVAGYIPLT